MAYRVAIVTLLMGATSFIYLKEGGGLLPYSVVPIYIVVGASYLVTLISLIALKFVKEVDLLANIQIAADTLLATAFVYVTGGIESIFSFLYIFVIIGSGTVLYLKGVFFTASLSSILYGALLDLQFYSYIPALESPLGQPQTYSGLQILYKIFINIAAFYIVAFLSSHSFAQLRKTGERLKEKEIDYEALEALYKKIVEEIKSGIVTIDLNGFITSFNRAAEEITGYTFKEAYGINVNEIFKGLMDRDSECRLYPAYSKGLGRCDTSYIDKSGNLRQLGFSISSMRGHEEEEIGSIIIFQDLTAYKDMEEAVKRAERLASIGQLAAGIAHEIRNPLASMSGSIQVLRDGLELDKDNRRLMDIILRETARLNRLITDFLEYARPYRPDKREVDLSCLILETLDVFEKGLPENQGITILREIAPGVKVYGEQERLEEVLWNLFNNALQSMFGGGELAVFLGMEGNVASVTVRDSGEGIEEKELSRIFEPFFTTKTYGTGLGLATVYRIVEAHDGDIRVDSEKGKGTTFTIFLPLMGRQ